MEIFWFCLGFALGIGALTFYRTRLTQRLHSVTQHLNLQDIGGTSPTAQLTLAIAHYRDVNWDLEEQVQTWKQIVNLAPVGYLQVDEENQLLWCNSISCSLLGMQLPADGQPRLLIELVRSYELDALIEQARTQPQPCQLEWVLYPTSVEVETRSEPRTIALRGTAFSLHQGNIGVFLENRQEAVTLAQQRDRWASDVAHELKTPLTSIRLVAETLQPRIDPALRSWIERLLNETIRLSLLVQELLDLGQLQLNPAQRLRRTAVDIPQIIHAAWSGLEPLAQEKMVELHYQGPDSLMIQADEARLHRVFLNLLDNSIQYSPSQRSIEVVVSLQSAPSPPGADPPDCLSPSSFQVEQSVQSRSLVSDTRQTPGCVQAYVQIDIMDSGSGFPETALPLVFERFYRADPARARIDRSREIARSSSTALPDSAFTQLSSGSGLGLAIVRQIVEAHQGQVVAKNHPVSGGAWLQVRLPKT